MRDIKFIITKDLKHYKSEYKDHYIIARDNGYDVKDILESGLIVDSQLYILECYAVNHRVKISKGKKFIANDVNKYLNELTEYRILKARQAESRLKYKYSGLPEGD